MTLKEQINMDHLPQHIAVIMDGNGRWAQQQGKPRIYGHQHAIQAIREVVEGCGELGVKALTLYAFSTENWNRPDGEVMGLMKLLAESIVKETQTLLDNDVRAIFSGELEKLPQEAYNLVQGVMERTKHCSRMIVNIALSYSGRWDILNATRKIAQEVKEGRLSPEQIDDQTFSHTLTTAELPELALMIRTGGEKRISNFLLWEVAYAELFFTDKYWPEFRKDDLYEAIIDYQHRERRFGKTSEQITKG